MSTIFVILCVALLLIIVVQIARVKELASKLRGEEEVEARSTTTVGRSLVAFMIVFLLVTTVTAFMYKNYMLGYGPHESASEHGKLIDSIFNWTLVTTYIVFVATHILLFWYAYKYRYNKNRKAQFISHNNMVEIVWTAIPALVMTFLVVGGLDAWNTIMADVGTDEEVLEIEATGYQFAWELRYPGADGRIGKKDFRLIDLGGNPLGMDFTDAKTHDDFIASELVLPVGQKIRVRITAKDVLHDFYLPHFRVKMDAVPGLPTYFVFTPEKTTEEYRQELRKYPEYNEPDPFNDEGLLKWETFEYELACAELCGIGHWSMKRRVRVVSQEEFNAWAAEQKSYYFSQVRGTKFDPYSDDFLPSEQMQIRQEFNNTATAALSTPSTDDDTFVLEYVFFNTASAELSNRSKYQLDEAAKWINAHPNVNVQLSGYTDAQGDDASNLALSERRAVAVRTFLQDAGVSTERLEAIGFGEENPRADNETEDGRAANRRTEFTIMPQGAGANDAI